MSLNIPSDCERGALVEDGWGSRWKKTYSSLNYTQYDQEHADVIISGSFCPLISGLYSISIDGKTDTDFCNDYTFDTKSGEHPITLNQNLYRGMCYYFYIKSCHGSMASVQMLVTVDGSSYVPSIPEIYTCKITECINGGNYQRNCIKRNTCTCKIDNKFKYSLFILCFLF